MGYHNDGFAARKLAERLLHFDLVIRVCKGGCLVKDEHRRVFEHSASNGNALHLTAGEINSLASDDCVHALRKFFDYIHALCGPERRHDLGLARLGLTEADIVKYAALDEPAVLEHEGYRVHKLVFGDLPDVGSAYPDAARLRIEKSGDNARKGRFSAA